MYVLQVQYNETRSYVVNYNGNVIIVKDVPCEECVQCGGKNFPDEVAMRLEAIVNEVKAKIQEFVVLDYNKVA